MKYFKNIILSISLLLFSLNIAKGQMTEIPTFTLNTVKIEASDKVTDSKDIILSVGPLKINAKFLFEGETVPYKAYLIKFKHVIRIKDALDGCNTSCDLLFNQVKKEYDAKLLQCQKNCDERVKIISSNNDLLKLEKKDLKNKLASEIRSKYIWTTVSALGGAGLGILVYSFAN